jgi:hypothetical protein
MTTQNLPQDKGDVVIVPAGRLAYPEYLKHGVYVCQRGKPVRKHVARMGFYADRAIQIHVPRIYYREDDIAFTYEEAAKRRTGQSSDRRIGQIIEISLNSGTRHEQMRLQVFLLSPPEDGDTVRLARRIDNDTLSSSGRHIAWARYRRYVSMARLTTPGITVTSQLDRQ